MKASELSSAIPISTLCRREGIRSNVYYKWLKDFMEAGKARLEGDALREATRAEVEALKREGERLRELVAVRRTALCLYPFLNLDQSSVGAEGATR